MTPETFQLIWHLGVIMTIYGILGSQGGKEESTRFSGYTLLGLGIALLLFVHTRTP